MSGRQPCKIFFLSQNAVCRERCVFFLRRMPPRTDNEIRVTPSVLDRLLDFEPKSQQEAPKSRSRNLRELKQSVRRDLEWLLNTRCFPDDIDENLEEVFKSVVVYGLPDITGVSAKNHLEQKRLTRAM
jgi:type VI secretion system protein ImpF